MDLKRLAQWLETMEGLAKAITALLVFPASIWAATTKVLDPVVSFLNLPPWVSIAAPVLIVMAIGLLLLLSFRRFYRSSRLEQPDAFTLRPTGPNSLVGRTEDLAGLLNSVKNNRMVLLDGESGCGKSALVSAGLIPSLQSLNGLLPVAICDWGDDWVRGPLSAAQDALFQSVSQIECDKLGWASSPDLAADTESLAVDLNARLKAVVDLLGRRPLLIADQFDDYQAQNRRRFVDDEGNWLSPSALARTNRFWDLISTGLIEGRLHLLVITRADSAAGLACVRFLDGDQTGTRTLPKVEAEYLRPLLAGIATDDAQPPIVSNPAGGWHELRERLEIDLKADRAILMQQVRTVLLGLRQLPVLTPRSYRSAGGLQGLGTLVISRSITRAGDAAGGGEAGIRIVRALLGRLILAGGPNQPPKAQRMLLSDLAEIVGEQSRTEAILKVLQHDEIVRSAEVGDCSNAWQLDHDYLARSVLAEARLADRWAVSLREYKARYEAAAYDWRQRWAALLPVGVLVRVCWERLRRRLEFGDAASYVRASVVRPAIALLCMVLIGVTAHAWYQDRALTLEAGRLIDKFGAEGEEMSAVLQIWRAPAPLRRRVYDLVNEDRGRLGRAISSAWPLAHAGFDATETREVAQILLARLEQEQDLQRAISLTQTYEAVLARLTDAAYVSAAATYLRTLLEHEQDGWRADLLADAYATVAVLLTDAEDIKGAAMVLRTLLVHEQAGKRAGHLLDAYTAVVAQLTDAADIKDAAKFLRTLLEHAPDDERGSALADPYAAVAARLIDAADIKDEATALRTLLEHAKDDERANTLVGPYTAVAVRLADAADIKDEAAALRTRLEHEQSKSLAYILINVYAVVAARLTNAADIKDEAVALRTLLLEHEQDDERALRIADVYAAVAARLTDAADIKDAAKALRTQLEQEQDGERASTRARSYAAVAARLTDAADIKDAATALRTLLEHEQDDRRAGVLADAYATVAAQLTDGADIKDAAMALGTRLEHEQDDWRADRLAGDYAAVAARLTDAADLKDAATALRTRMEHEEGRGHSSILADAYATVVTRLTDVADIKDEATALRTQLEHELSNSRDYILKGAYTAVAARLTDAADIKDEVTALRKLLEHEQLNYVIENAYEKVAARLTDAADIKDEATALRKLLEHEQDDRRAGILAHAYVAVAVRLTDAADIKSAATALRTRLMHEQDRRRTTTLADDYAAIAARLTDAADIKVAATTLRAQLEHEQDGILVNYLAKDYAIVTGAMVDRIDDRADRLALVREILLIAGHPFVNNYAPLLAALKPIAGTDFGGNIGAAVSWAEQSYGIKPEELRPMPVER